MASTVPMLVSLITLLFVEEHVSRSVSGVILLAVAVSFLLFAAYYHWSSRSNLKVDTANAECGNEGDKAMIKDKLVSNPLACLPALTVGGLVQADSGGFDELDSTILQLRMAEGWTNWKIRSAWGFCLVGALMSLYGALQSFLCSSDASQLWDDSCYARAPATAAGLCGCGVLAYLSFWCYRRLSCSYSCLRSMCRGGSTGSLCLQ